MSEQQNMAEQKVAAAAIETLKSKQEGAGILRIERSLDGQSITLYIKHPLLADIVEQMANGNAPAEVYASIYKPILAPIEGHATRVWSKPAVSKITKNFLPEADFSWEAPRGVLIYNAKALREGYTLTYKVETPFAPDTARRWGKMFLDGCNDIIANARPFQMTWVMKEKLPAPGEALPAAEPPPYAPPPENDGPPF